MYTQIREQINMLEERLKEDFLNAYIYPNADIDNYITTIKEIVKDAGPTIGSNDIEVKHNHRAGRIDVIVKISNTEVKYIILYEHTSQCTANEYIVIAVCKYIY